MKRYTLRILLCLLLGVVTTVGVAWGSIMWVPERDLSWDQNQSIVSDQPWPKIPPEDWPNNASLVFLRDDYGVTYVDALTYQEDSGFYTQNVRRSGLPMRCMQRIVNSAGQRHSVPSDWHEGLRVPAKVSWIHRRLEDEALVPLIPIWPGFLINTLFYAVIWFGLFNGIGATRRAIRRKRSNCIKCGYNLRGDIESGCSECGWNRTETETREVEQ